MTGRPRHTRHDANQAALVRDLVRLGAVIWDLSDVGGEVLDLVVFWRGQTRVVEVKPSKRAYFTAHQMDSILRLRTVGITVIIAVTAEDVIEAWEENTNANSTT